MKNDDYYSKFLQPVCNPLPISSTSKQLKENKEIVCHYCTEFQESKHCGGGDGIMYDANENKYYFVAEHFRHECVEVEINYCPMCGRKLG